jgi:hypothetical protein
MRSNRSRASRRNSLPFVLAVIALAAAALAAVGAGTQGERFDAASFWRAPLASQGKPPTDWSALEQSLSPEDCGQCHADQWQQWRTSRHALAFSPGLVGQLLTFDSADTAECMRCHAPLAEQGAAFEAARTLGVAHVAEKQGLAAAGNGCGGCHLRQHRRFGPPQRDTGITGPSEPAAPHGGVLRTAFFESSEFCSGCHQFPSELAVNGKPLENTYAEWKASPQATAGTTCQSCHMPERRHLWRGIHDPATIAAGLTPRIAADQAGVRFEITNSGIGHAFPTYVTPKVVLNAVALDADGKPRPDTLVSHVIARRVSYDGERWREESDTRLLPGQTASIAMPWNGSVRARVWLEVFPDDYYENAVYRELVETLPRGSEALRLIARAKTEAAASRFRLFETELSRP